MSVKLERVLGITKMALFIIRRLLYYGTVDKILLQREKIFLFKKLRSTHTFIADIFFVLFENVGNLIIELMMLLQEYYLLCKMCAVLVQGLPQLP